MKQILSILIISVFFIPININAARGCCSWHGGVDYCGDGGYYICNDGTQSPSCTCQSSKSYDYILTDTSCDCSEYKSEIETKEEEIIENEEEISNLKKQIESTEANLSDYQLLFWITLITFIIYFIYKNKEK